MDITGQGEYTLCRLAGQSRRSAPRGDIVHLGGEFLQLLPGFSLLLINQVAAAAPAPPSKLNLLGPEQPGNWLRARAFLGYRPSCWVTSERLVTATDALISQPISTHKPR